MVAATGPRPRGRSGWRHRARRSLCIRECICGGSISVMPCVCLCYSLCLLYARAYAYVYAHAHAHAHAHRLRIPLAEGTPPLVFRLLSSVCGPGLPTGSPRCVSFAFLVRSSGCGQHAGFIFGRAQTQTQAQIHTKPHAWLPSSPTARSHNGVWQQSV